MMVTGPLNSRRSFQTRNSLDDELIDAPRAVENRDVCGTPFAVSMPAVTVSLATFDYEPHAAQNYDRYEPAFASSANLPGDVQHDGRRAKT